MAAKANNPSGSLCPAMASADLLGDKWTLLIVRELLLGTTRFSRFQRAIPRMSPSILSKRLRMLESAGIIIRISVPTGQAVKYNLTRSGRELGPIIEGMAIWGMRWRSRTLAAQDCDVSSFMWDFHRTLKTEGLPEGETVIEVQISDRSELNKWWMIATGDMVDLCLEDPGHDVDVYLTTSLEQLVSIWMGEVEIKQAIKTGGVFLDGPKYLINTAQDWISQSPLVGVDRVKS